MSVARDPLLELTGAVIGGGRSSRMGREKALLDFGDETLAARVVGRLRTMFRHVLVAANDAAPYAGLGVPVVPDLAGAGPLAGIAAALSAAPTEHVFCCAVDMPFLSAALVRHLCALARGGVDVVIPRGPEGAGRASPLEPLHAVYSRACLPRLRERLAAGSLKVDAALEGLAVEVVERADLARLDPGGLGFVNVNTPEEYARALALERSNTREAAWRS